MDAPALATRHPRGRFKQTLTLAALLRDLGILAAVFLAVTALAYVAGAENTGTAATFGEVAFAVVLVALIVRGRR